MIDKLFYSNNNKNAIKAIIIENINISKYQNNFDFMLNDTMEYVLSQVSNTPPKGMKVEEYIFLMNKKVFDLILPILKKENSKISKPPQQPPIFDSLVNNYEIPAVMEYPKPSIYKEKNENIIKKLENEKDERNLLKPKIRPIDFTIKPKEEEYKINTLDKYNELLSIYDITEDIQNELSTPIHQLPVNQPSIDQMPINKMPIHQLPVNQPLIDQMPINQTLIIEPKMKLIEKKFIFTIDSSDRDLFEYPLQTFFQVKLAPAGNNLVYNTYYDELGTLILFEKTISYGDGSNASINETFDNIKSIRLTDINVPNNIIYNGSNDIFIGEATNIYQESYTYLVIPELRGPYRSNNSVSNNAFAKLIIPTGSIGASSSNIIQNNFTILQTSTSTEYFLYDPVLNGKLDKMTLHFYNKHGKLYNFGIDKLYIESFMPGSYKYYGNCGDKYLSTRLLIQNKNDEYKKYCNTYYPNSNPCNYLNSNPVLTSDLIYFYNTRPNYDQVIYLEDYINISKLVYDNINHILKISASYFKDKNIQINFKDIISEGLDNNYYIVLYDVKKGKYHYLKIHSFSGKSVFVNYNYSEKLSLSDYKSIRLGITKSNLRGSNNDDPQSIFYNNGYYVLSKGNLDPYTQEVDNSINIENMDNISFLIEINFPYHKLPDYLKDNDKYVPGEIFIIQEKMQLSYTFEVTSLIKDYSIVSSNINESGNN